MRVIVVVMEYLGAGLGAGTAGRRVPFREHACDLETGILVGHLPGHPLRVGFPCRQRGWNSPPRASRCPACDAAVQRIVRGLIAAAVAAVTGRDPPPSPAPQ